MRAIIYGAGAVGSVVGGHLVRVGKDVILIGRSGHTNAIRKHGLRLITPTGTHILQMPAVTVPNQICFRPDDVVLLCVKSQSTNEALSNLRAMTEDIPIFCFQNGVRNEESASHYFPKVYGVRLRMRCVFLTDGEVIARDDPPGSLVMGRYPEGTDDLVEAMAENLRTAGFSVFVTPGVMPYKWGKLVDQLDNAIDAITNARGNDRNLIRDAAQHEAHEILAQAGVRWVSEEELALEWPQSPRHKSLDVEAKNSTWQSLARRRGTVETEFINGEIVRLANLIGTQAPVNETLWLILEEMAANSELPGKYTLTELRRLIGLD